MSIEERLGRLEMMLHKDIVDNAPQTILEGTPRSATGSSEINRRVYIAGNTHIVGSTRCENRIDVYRGDIKIHAGNLTAQDVLISSSQELKQDISPLSLDESQIILEDLEPVKFAFKNDPSKRENIGFIAEEVPDVIASKDHKQVRYMEIISALTKVVKEQQKEIENLKEHIKTKE